MALVADWALQFAVDGTLYMNTSVGVKDALAYTPLKLGEMPERMTLPTKRVNVTVAVPAD